MKCYSKICKYSDTSDSGCELHNDDMDKRCNHFSSKATPPPKPSGTMERALEKLKEERDVLGKASELLAESVESSRQSGLGWKHWWWLAVTRAKQEIHDISKAQQEEGK